MKARRISAERTLRRHAFDPYRAVVYPSCEGHCDNEFFPFTIEQHHIVPLGELEENDTRYLCFLCPNCHRLVHVFRKLFQGKLPYHQISGLEAWLENTELPLGYEARVRAIARADIRILEREYGFRFH